ncbi:formylglycine-generating enzyme family protein [Myxococcota bacterium]|nr:formylglycine-generating enzyme family protein [Myxococcota bacterium]MBU1410205.1 formylglycine-generating enzyme family protein [Myxococcota bacterium]MBU1512439.1 formylglycine-generating enzyme family protein [Myxococcota bacterium]
MTNKTWAIMTLAAFLMLIGCDTKTKNVDSCGDGFVDPGEECDGNIGENTCASLGHYNQTGTLVCTPLCKFDTADCGGRCGDGIPNGTDGEQCDGNNLDGNSCLSLGYTGGTLTCAGDCTFEVSACAGRCGNGVIDTEDGEVCDGGELAEETCQTQGYGQGSGALGCTAGCALDETACVAISANADLSTLTVSEGTLVPQFSAATTSYTVMVHAPTTVTVTATGANPYASVNIAPAQPMTLTLGDNPATVTVTAESGAQKVYSVLITLNPDYLSPYVGTLKHVPAGTFQRDATPTNLSTVSAFRMSQTEITRAQWVSVTGWADPSNVTYSSGTNDPVQYLNWYHTIAFCNKLSLLEGLTPVYTVSGVNFSTLTYAEIPTTDNATWNAATANWAANGYRLPTEMEWMWAAMGADTANPGVTNTTGYAKAFAGSNGVTIIDDYAWCGDNGLNMTHPAGTKLPNELGLYDMSGNVWERLWDWYDYFYPSGAVTDYRGPASGTARVSRGGGFSNAPPSCTVANRGNDNPYNRNFVLGFRVVRN